MTNSWSFGGYPEMVYELCASQQHEGEAQLWVLDTNDSSGTIKQDKQGNWMPWEGNWNKPPGNTVFKKDRCAVRGHHARRAGLGHHENGKLSFL
jgi:hypothetical protein